MSVPARFRLVVEGSLEHQAHVLDALRAVAKLTGCTVVARAERPTEMVKVVSDDGMADLLDEFR